MEFLIVGLIILMLVSLLSGLVLSPIALLTARNVQRRLRELERRVAASAETEEVEREEEVGRKAVATAESPREERPAAREGAVPEPSSGWEAFLGRQALGWVAVALLLFGVAFFLRYAFENNWIGPMGQVSLGILAGTGLVVLGWWYDFFRGWNIFSQIVTGAGLLLLYLSTFAAFGYYTVLTEQIGGLFLLLIVAAGALLAVLYNARALALMTEIGGLLVPLLLQSPHDQYRQLFICLGLLSAGLLLVTYVRRWSWVSVVLLAGTHALFWLWYSGNYHPEKMAWALGFQAAVLVLFLTHSLAAHVVQPRQANVADLIRLALTAFAWFVAAYVMLKQDYEPWLGSLAVAMAVIYAGWARLALWRRSDDPRQTLAALAVAVGFATVALPIQAEAHWVALGWAAEGAALWWFGLRIRSGGALRGMAAVLAVLAVGRLLLVDTPWETREPFVPLWNTYGLPALGVAACLIGSVVVGMALFDRLRRGEQMALPVAGLGGVLLVWIILSVETFGWFDARAALDDTDADSWRRLGQMSLSGLWAVYASVILAIGFWRDQAPLRWTALALYALTVMKVLLFDMAGLAELYRIGAFLVVAVILGVAAWAYQRLAPQVLGAQHSSEET